MQLIGHTKFRTRDGYQGLWFHFGLLRVQGVGFKAWVPQGGGQFSHFWALESIFSTQLCLKIWTITSSFDELCNFCSAVQLIGLGNLGLETGVKAYGSCLGNFSTHYGWI